MLGAGGWPAGFPGVRSRPASLTTSNVSTWDSTRAQSGRHKDYTQLRAFCRCSNRVASYVLVWTVAGTEQCHSYRVTESINMT